MLKRTRVDVKINILTILQAARAIDKPNGSFNTLEAYNNFLNILETPLYNYYNPLTDILIRPTFRRLDVFINCVCVCV